MFSQPLYWSELVASRPCFLVGGRGTGKTTALRALGYRSQAKQLGLSPASWRLIGSYWRIESNVTTAFTGSRVTEDRWVAIFSHYVNLRLCDLVLDYLVWADSELGLAGIDWDTLAPFYASFGISGADNILELRSRLVALTATLEASLNGKPEDLAHMQLSLLGRPVQYLLTSLTEAVLPEGSAFAFCIDEYENLLPYQQRVINTLVKHVGDAPYTLKIGVRSTTPGERSTLATGQPLHDPADYTTIRIVEHLKEQSFQDFASSVCSKRLAQGISWDGDISYLFPGLSMEDEAQELGIRARIDVLRAALAEAGASKYELTGFDDLAPLSQYLIEYWAVAQNVSVVDVLREALTKPERWATRVGNYSYAALFTIKAGKRGTRKFYSGWPMICLLAEGNIRVLLRLVHEALRIHVSAYGQLSPVSAEDQTQAAIRIGGTVLRELSAQSPRGADITRLTLSLGRIFGALAASPEGRTPEVNQIRVTFQSNPSVAEEAMNLLDQAVAAGAIDPFEGNKEGRTTGGTKRPDYRLMPVFAPYFVFSHRKKRRLTVTDSQVLALASTDSGRAISGILHKGNKKANQSPLPEQLLFYEEHFGEA